MNMSAQVKVNFELREAKKRYHNVSPFQLAYNLDVLKTDFPTLARWIGYSENNFIQFIKIWKDIKVVD